jgi:biotin synthase
MNGLDPSNDPAPCRHDWSSSEIAALIETPLNDLLLRAHLTHRRHFAPNRVQLSTLLNIKNGGCPEDCAYCPQSARYAPGKQSEGLADLDTVLDAAERARAAGATRFCMGAAWRSPRDRDLDTVLEMIAAVKRTGMETCVTLGMLTAAQAVRLKAGGLDYYNHNLDSSAEFYQQIISTRRYTDRLETLSHVRAAGLKVCCGGIVGMGETVTDRAGLLATLAAFPEHPESVPINMLVRVRGTPLGELAPIDPLDLVRTVAAARVVLPRSYIRLSAGRAELSESEQALCFFAGANSIFYGERLLTTDNPEHASDRALFAKLGIEATTNPS